jgi:hypothetical protein
MVPSATQEQVTGGVGGGPAAEVGAGRECVDPPFPLEARRRPQIHGDLLGDRRVIAVAHHPQRAPAGLFHDREVVRRMPARRLVLPPARRDPARPDGNAAPVLDDAGRRALDGRGGQRQQECAS